LLQTHQFVVVNNVGRTNLLTLMPIYAF